MDIFTKLNIYRNAIRHINFYFSEEKKENALPGKMMGEIIRNVHSIEKGLSLEKPRKFFGYKKIMDMFELLDSYDLQVLIYLLTRPILPLTIALTLNSIVFLISCDVPIQLRFK